MSLTNAIIILHVAIIIAVGLRVVSQQAPAGVTLAWLMLVSSVPFGGAIAYLMIGERRISFERSGRFTRNRQLRQQTWNKALDSGWGRGGREDADPVARGLSKLGWASAASPTVAGTVTHLFEDFDKVVDGMVADIDTATTALLIETYIWLEEGRIGEISDALVRAARRGVECRVLADAVGAAAWFRSSHPERLREHGIKVVAALPVGLFRSILGRADLRLHRKVMTIDNRIGWTGSMNMVDPRHFKQDAGVGEWMDSMVRLEGRIVAALATTILIDWAQERDDPVTDLLRDLDFANGSEGGSCGMQAIPSGPGITADGLQLMLMSLIGAAQERVIISTPYFAPDEPLLKAIRAAAGRGVAVSIILPKMIDSLLVRYASRSFFGALLASGVQVYEFGGGLLHTKSISVDGKIAMFGSVNMDYRSLWLNYEIALFFYGAEFTGLLEKLQNRYLLRSTQVDAAAWGRRPAARRLVENLFRLFIPLL